MERTWQDILCGLALEVVWVLHACIQDKSIELSRRGRMSLELATNCEQH